VLFKLTVAPNINGNISICTIVGLLNSNESVNYYNNVNSYSKNCFIKLTNSLVTENVPAN